MKLTDGGESRVRGYLYLLAIAPFLPVAGGRRRRGARGRITHSGRGSGGGRRPR